MGQNINLSLTQFLNVEAGRVFCKDNNAVNELILQGTQHDVWNVMSDQKVVPVIIVAQ